MNYQHGALVSVWLLLAGCSEDSAASIPHGVASTSDARCADCHNPHDTGCVDCHSVKESWLPLSNPPATAPDTAAPATPHETPKLTDGSCLDCHGNGDWQATVPDHTSTAGCVSCHGPS